MLLFGGTALAWSLASLGSATVVLTAIALLALAAALRPRTETSEAIATWLLAAALVGEALVIARATVETIEAYTLPLAAGLLAISLITLRRRAISSWLVYAPGLLVGFVPSLAIVLVGPDAGPVRPLALTVGAAVAVTAGALTQRQAPLVIGACVAAAVAVRSISPVMPRLTEIVPIWVPLGALGVALILLGATWEKRSHELRRLTATVREMR
jgi:hypothetical protein